MGDMDDHSDNGLGQFFSTDGPGELMISADVLAGSILELWFG
jgi:hypothetical protein